MAIWFRNRPAEQADPTERIVADYLDRLDDEWLICWGYYYEKTCREGDFILLGPSGQLLVMEVKGGQNRQFLLTGRWEGSRDGDNPLEQLRAQWSAILERVQTACATDAVPWVGHALCMPNLNRTGIERLHAQFGDALMVTRRELENFPAWWQREVTVHRNRCPHPRGAFHEAVVPHQKPAAIDLFIRETDRLFDRYRSAEAEILDMLAENPQWVVEGGPGTGKTFLALQRAQQLAESGPAAGRHVVFLCYNLILASQVEEMVGRLKLRRGSITVRSWEALVEGILARADIPLAPPDDPVEKFRYYMQEVPAYVCAILEENPPEPLYDALVIDEAQDHDTAFEGASAAHPLGWWSWYFALLRGGARAPLAVFLDLAQRPNFRREALFSLPALREALASPTHVRLRRVLRYTRQVHAYLAGLPFAIAAEFARLALPADSLPEGPEVVETSAAAAGLPAAIAAIVRQWTHGQARRCRVDDIVIMGFRRQLSGSALRDVPEIAGFPLVDYAPDGPRGALRYIGLHRAKGLDFLGVILIGLPLPAALAAAADRNGQEAFFHGATRARQLLAVMGEQNPQ